MIITQKPTYTHLISERNSFDLFFEEFKTKFTQLSQNHIIISISSTLKLKETDIFVFLKYSELQQQNGMTFAIVYPNVDVDQCPESLIIVPTLKEAEDVLEMENIERDLGF